MITLKWVALSSLFVASKKQFHYCPDCGSIMFEDILFSSRYWRCPKCEPTTADEPEEDTEHPLWRYFKSGVLEKTGPQDHDWKSNNVEEAAFELNGHNLTIDIGKPTQKVYTIDELNREYMAWDTGWIMLDA